MTTNTAFGRARRSGVDWLDIEPRPLRTRRRLDNTPARVTHQAWDQTFDVLDNSLKTVRR